MRISDIDLISFIVDSGLASRRETEDVLHEAQEKGIDAGTILVSKGVIREEDLGRAQAYILGLPYVNLEDKPLDIEILSLIPEPLARKANAVAFHRSGDEVEVALLNPRTLADLNFLKLSGFKVLPRLASEKSIRSALHAYQVGLRSRFGEIIQQEVAAISEDPYRNSGAKLVDALLKHALAQGASDVHYEPREENLLIRYRLNGQMREAMILPLPVVDAVHDRIRTLSGLPQSNLPQEGRFRIELHDESVSIRISTIPTVAGEKMVMRILREGSEGFSLESLGLVDEGLEIVHQAIHAPSGLIIVAGEKESGKTSTLYTLLDIIKRPEISVSTVERKVEYRLSHVSQVELRLEAGLDMPRALRGSLRLRPDVLMIDPIQDAESALLAAHASLSSLVLVSIEAKDTGEARDKFSGWGISKEELAPMIKAVICQRLEKQGGKITGKFEVDTEL